MKKQRILSALLALCLVFSLVPTALAAGADDFTDVGKDSWCYDYVDYVTSEGYFLGTTDTTFSPNRNMTRAMFVVVLSRFDSVEVDNSQSSFTDVEPGAWCAGAIEWAAENGIVTGKGDGRFAPNDPITRAQMCAIMDRYVDYYTAKHGVVVAQKGTASTLADQSQVPAYAADAVRNCQIYGLINGYQDGSFRPQAYSTRAHVAAIIYRLAFLIDGAKDADKYVVCPDCGELVPKGELRCPSCGYKFSGGAGAQSSQTKPGSGRPSTEPDEPDEGRYTYQLTYKDTDGGFLRPTVKKTTDETSYRFPAYYPEKAGLTFLGWSLRAGGDVVYPAGERIELTKDRPELTVYAVWDEDLDPDDLIGWAVRNTIEDPTVKNYIDKVNEIGGSVSGASAKVIFPSNKVEEDGTYETLTITDSVVTIVEDPKTGAEIKTRPLTMTINADVSDDIVADLIETAAATAVGMLSDEGTPGEMKSAIQEIVDSIKAELAEHGIEVSGKTTEEIVKAVYEKLLETGSGLWRQYFYKAADPEADEESGDQKGGFYTGKVTVSVGDETATILINETNTQNQTTLEDCATREDQIAKAEDFALAIAHELYADLTTYESYTSQVTMDSVVTVTFSKPVNEKYAAKTDNFPYVYPVTLQLNLDGGDLVEYKFVEGTGSYVKLHLTEKVQKAYTDAVNEILEAALEQQSVQELLDNNIKEIVQNNGQLKTLIAKMKNPLGIADAEKMVTDTMNDLILAYVKNDGQSDLDNSAVYDLIDNVAKAAIGYVDNYLDNEVGATFAVGIKKSATPEALMEQLDKLDGFDLGFLEKYPDVEKYVFAVVSDALRKEVGDYTTTFADDCRSDMEDGVDELIQELLNDSNEAYSKYQGYLEQIQALHTIAAMEDVTLGTMLAKLEALNDELDFTDKLSTATNDSITALVAYLNKAANLPGDVSIQAHDYTLDKDVLTDAFDGVDSVAEAYDALTGLMEEYEDLSLSDFTDVNGVPVTVSYKTKNPFTFYLVLEIDPMPMTD